MSVEHRELMEDERRRRLSEAGRRAWEALPEAEKQRRRELLAAGREVRKAKQKARQVVPTGSSTGSTRTRVRSVGFQESSRRATGASRTGSTKPASRSSRKPTEPPAKRSGVERVVSWLVGT